MNQNKTHQLLKALLVSAAVFVLPISSASALTITPPPTTTPAPVSGAERVHHESADVHGKRADSDIKDVLREIDDSDDNDGYDSESDDSNQQNSDD